jgi:hypothetical protein
MAVAKPTGPMIRMLIESLAHEGFEVIGNRSTRDGLVARGLAVPIESAQSANSGIPRTGHWAPARLTGEALTLIREETGRSEAWRLGGVDGLTARAWARVLLVEGPYLVRTAIGGGVPSLRVGLSFADAVDRLYVALMDGVRMNVQEGGVVVVFVSGSLLDGQVFEPDGEVARQVRVVAEGVFEEVRAEEEAERAAWKLVGGVAEWEMRVGVLREDARVMGRYGAANVRAAIVSGWEQGQRAVLMESGEIRVGYSWFAPVVLVVGEGAQRRG